MFYDPMQASRGDTATIVGVTVYCDGMTKTEHTTREQVESQRAAILNRLGVTLDELSERADAGELVGDEWLAWAEVSELTYLLGE